MHEATVGHWEGDEEELFLADDGYPINPDWLRFSSVGIDIGSSTSHLMFSKLVLQRQSEGLSSQFVVVDRMVMHRSPVLLTPYCDPVTIDTEALSRFIDQSYTDAGLRPDEIDTGAVICTGEAVRKHNAEAIVRMLSEKGGRFVAATAGPNLEAMLGAHGSGAVARSLEGRTVVNVDVGGGTSKISLAQDGMVVEVASINVGARLVAWDGNDRIVRIEDTGRQVATHVGIDPQLGSVISGEQKSRLAEGLADILLEALQHGPMTSEAEALMITPELTFDKPVDEISFSGGVAEYIDGADSTEYGDLGPLLGAAIRARLPRLDVPMVASAERIRATVIGASQYTVQVSSSTVYASVEEALPMLDLQVVPVRLPEDPGAVTREGVASDVAEALRLMDVKQDGSDRNFALALSGPMIPSYPVVLALAEGIADGLEAWRDRPWVLVLGFDLAGFIGSVLKEDLNVVPDVIVVDGIQVGALDYIDVGEKIESVQAIPVVVKSLIFE